MLALDEVAASLGAFGVCRGSVVRVCVSVSVSVSVCASPWQPVALRCLRASEFSGVLRAHSAAIVTSLCLTLCVCVCVCVCVCLCVC